MSQKLKTTIKLEALFEQGCTNPQCVELMRSSFPNKTDIEIDATVRKKRSLYNSRPTVVSEDGETATPLSPTPIVPYKIPNSNSEYKEDISKGEAEISRKTTKHIKSLADLISECEIDIAVWDIDRWVCNKWEVGAKDETSNIVVTPLFQIKAWLKKKSKSKDEVLSDFKLDLLNTIKTIKVPKQTQIHIQDSGVLVEIDMFDPHFGKLAWKPEIGEDYDMNIAEERYFNALHDLLKKASIYNIKQILLPIGNDYFHYDTLQITTTAGTRQDSDSRWQRMFRRGVEIAIKAIEVCRLVAPVYVMHVAGNHDTQTGFYMSELLAARYHHGGGTFVEIDKCVKTRKYYRFGKCGIGFTHGNNEKHSDLVQIMLREQQRDWSDVAFMEWHLGHFHQKRETKYLAFNEAHGISIRILRSLSAPDAWHFEKGYVQGLKGAEAFIWDAEYGNVANMSSILI